MFPYYLYSVEVAKIHSFLLSMMQKCSMMVARDMMLLSLKKRRLSRELTSSLNIHLPTSTQQEVVGRWILAYSPKKLHLD